MFGEFHPKYKRLEDYDHYKRDTNNQVIIEATVSGFTARLGNGAIVLVSKLTLVKKRKQTKSTTKRMKS